jgi:hypothetical protein
MQQMLVHRCVKKCWRLGVSSKPGVGLGSSNRVCMQQSAVALHGSVAQQVSAFVVLLGVVLSSGCGCVEALHNSRQLESLLIWMQWQLWHLALCSLSAG